jgi:dTDP-4-amino-4,6-dideoxygalactose transaminase
MDDNAAKAIMKDLQISDVRKTFLPFSLPTIGEEEKKEILDCLDTGWITTGPKVARFEKLIEDYVGATHALAVSSATAGLHVTLLSLGIGRGDEVITTPMTFVSTINMIVNVGATPVLADIDRSTLNISVPEIRKRITPRTRAIIPVHFAGQPCDMDAIVELARKKKLAVIEDAAHAIGTEYKGRRIGTGSEAVIFSFHPIKNMTTGEGGIVTTERQDLFEKISLYRFHGMSRDAWKRYDGKGIPQYDILLPGFKYNMMDIQAALGIHQLARLDGWIDVRRRYAMKYRQAFAGMSGLILPTDVSYEHRHAWHLFVVMLDLDCLTIDRNLFMAKLRDRNIGTGLHFVAAHLHPAYRKQKGFRSGRLPAAEWVSERIVSLPLYPKMSESDVDDVIAAVKITLDEALKSKKRRKKR